MVKLHVLFFLLGAALVVHGDDADNVYPCGSSSISYDCAKKYIGDMGFCTVVDTPVEKPEFDIALPLYVPLANATAIVKDVVLDSSLKGDIKEFFYDSTTGQYVISVHFSLLYGKALTTTFIIDRDGKEPKVISDYAEASYPVTITANIPSEINELNIDALRNAVYTVTVHSNDGTINVGPKLMGTTDPEIQSVLMALFVDLPLTFEEIHRTKATFYFLAWLQNYLCDFGLHPVLEDRDLSVASNLNEVDTDDESNWSKPCDGVDLETCVRDYFSEQGSCSVVSTSDDGPVTRGLFYSYIPSESVTLVTPETTVTGLDGNIRNFYINELTNNLVITVDFDEIGAETPETTVVLYQTGDVAKTITDYGKVTYGVSVTATIPLPLSAESIKKAHVSAFTSNVQVEMGTQVKGSTDPVIASLVESVTANRDVVGREIMVTTGYNYFLLYLQKHICNYDIPNTYTP